MICMLSDEGDVVLDPFSGRGTTLLEARLTGRIPLSSDLNPIATALTKAKNVVIARDDILDRINELERKYDNRLYVPEAQVQPDNIRLIYHPHTLAQLCYLRRRLLSNESPRDLFLVGVVLGIMHGSDRQDGTSAYASISMPNTFSMAPEYVRRFVETKRLQRTHRNVFQLLREKVERLFREGTDFKTSGWVTQADAKQLTSTSGFRDYVGKVRLILTSPPYLDVVNYARQNWIRAWFMKQDPETISSDLDDNLTLAEWLEFIESTVWEMKNMLCVGGVAVLVIGDVAKSNMSVVSLAREFIRLIYHHNIFSYVGCLTDHIQVEEKTTRIWGETKGKATSVDRLVILADREPRFNYDHLGKMSSGGEFIETMQLDPKQLQEYAYSFAG